MLQTDLNASVCSVKKYIQGGPERMQRFWSVISTRFLIEYHWFLLYWIEYYIKSNLTPSSSCMDKAFWFYGYFSEAVSFSKCATFSPESSLEAERIFCLTASYGPRSEKEDNMNETEAFITQLCGRPGRWISIVVLNRDVPVCIMVRGGEKAWSAVNAWQVRVGHEEQWEYM